MNLRSKFLQSLRCQLLGHTWSVWRKVSKKHQHFRVCTNCDARELKLMTPDEVRASEEKRARAARRKRNAEPVSIAKVNPSPGMQNRGQPWGKE